MRPVREPPVGKAAESPELRAKENFYRTTAVLQRRENIINSPKIDRVRQKNAFKTNYHEISYDPWHVKKKSENCGLDSLPQQQNMSKDDIIRNRNKNNRSFVDRRLQSEMSVGKDSVPEQVSGRHHCESSWDM